MSANFEAKKLVVEDIKAKIQNSKSVVFVKFSGLTVAEDTELRREFRKNNVEYKVYKNTLIRKAFESLGVSDFNEDLNGPTAVAFGIDETGAAKVIVDAAKKYQDKVVVKSAYFEEGGMKSIICLDGEGVISCGGEEFAVNKGDSYLVPKACEGFVVKSENDNFEIIVSEA